MVALIILGILALLIFLICMITVGVDLRYIGGELTVFAKLCGFLLQIYPKRKKSEKPKEEKPPEKPKPKEEPEKKPKKQKKKKKKKDPGLMIDGYEVIDVLKKLLEGLGKFSKGIDVDTFLLHYVAAGNDPYNTARIFAFVNALLSALAPVCAERFSCRHPDVWTDIDFTETKMKLDVEIAVVLRVGAVFAMLFTILFGVLGILIRNKWNWFVLKHTDREEYEFRVRNPGLATKLIRSILEKDDAPEEAPDKAAAEEGSAPAIPDAMESGEDKQEIIEEERKPSNG